MESFVIPGTNIFLVTYLKEHFLALRTKKRLKVTLRMFIVEKFSPLLQALSTSLQMQILE